MSDEVRPASDFLPQLNTSQQYVLFDRPSDTYLGLASSFSSGITRAKQLLINPSVMQRFTVIGFNVQMSIVGLILNTLNVAGGHWAQFGSIWGGLYINTTLPTFNNLAVAPNSQNSPQFPPDLSTFAEIWNGKTDDIRVIDQNINPPFDSYCTVIARNIMLPTPILIRPSSNLAFGVVMTPSLFSAWTSLLIVRCSYTVLYTVETLTR